ncbi:hypothetical protein POTOM_058386 [Populus tomentosa]|uniref:Uncharacterized protein n=1 Tax=Populus tomentosa TaxID=118781 RepID=A0A8X7XV43_POPTO|nr:hypothetical protein POTOM_058386 [Populus tomentosa]
MELGSIMEFLNNNPFWSLVQLDFLQRFDNFNNALKVFDDISSQNIASRNVCLKGLWVWTSTLHALDRNLKRGMRLAKLYEPYVFFKGM